MGIYIYRLEPKTRKHPIYGEVGVLRYWEKVAWFGCDAIDRQERLIRRFEEKWAERVRWCQGLPRFVVIRKLDGTIEPQVYDFSKNGSAVWYDTDPLPEATPPG